MLTNSQKNVEKKKWYLPQKKKKKVKIMGFIGGHSTRWLYLSKDTNF